MNPVPCEGSNTSLVSVEEMINSAIGIDKNRINYKMIQAIFHIMARQMRVLKSQVDLRICDPVIKKKKKMEEITSSSSSSSSTDSPRHKEKKERKAREKKEKAEKAAQKAKEEAEAAAAAEARARAREEAQAEAQAEIERLTEKMKKKETEGEDEMDEKVVCEEADLLALSDETISGVKRPAEGRKMEKADKLTETEKDQLAKGKDAGVETAGEEAAKKKKGVDVSTDQEGFEKEDKKKAKGKGKAGKDKGKTGVEGDEESESDRDDQGEKKKRKGKKDTEESSDSKEKEARAKKKGKAEEESADEGKRAKKDKKEKLSPEEKAQFEIEEQKREKERLGKMSPKEREKYEKEKQKEKEMVDKMSQVEREQYEKDKEEEIERMSRMSPKEREKYEKEKEKEKKKVEKMSPEEREIYEQDKKLEKERLGRLSPSQRDVFEREKEREREKAAKMSPKEREKYEKEKKKEKEKIEKMSPEEREQYERYAQTEREKMDKMGPKEREKYEKEKEKEKEKIEKMSPKDREKYEKEKRLAQRTPSGTGISIKESQRKGEKVLVVEKGPTTYGAGRVPRVGSVECVTRSEFELLEAAVKSLKAKAGPLPMPAMPDNKRLLDDIAKGSASLTDTMQAMQMAARLQAAEAAIERMAGLLTQLAASGALPKEVVTKIGTITAGLYTGGPSERDDRNRYASVGGGATQGPGGKSVAIDPASGGMGGILDEMGGMKSAMRRGSAGSTLARSPGGRSSVSSHASTFGTTHVTHGDMGDAMDGLTENLKAYLAAVIAKAQSNCESAAASVKSVEDKMMMALKLNGRLSTLNSLVTDYSQQLNGFDAGLTTQMSGFHEQMILLRKDLAGGLQQLEKANNNAETAALNELNDRYETLVTELDQTLNDHGKLNMLNKQLGDELRGLVAAVEILREQKADRDEVLDGLRDKADTSRLQGLLTEEAFAVARSQLEDRLDLCYDKFHKQENVWMDAVKDLSDIAAQKAELMQLLAAKDDAQTQLREMQEKLAKLALVLGEPMAALVTRQVSKNATCGPCMVPALQNQLEPSFGKPLQLPQARPAPLGQEEPCMKDVRPPHPPEERLHTCLRWVGGSHTLVSESVRRSQAPSTVTALGPPVRVYPAEGTDGRLYVMADEIVPCEECNQCYRDKRPDEEPVLNAHVEVCLTDGKDKTMDGGAPPAGDGAGDTGHT